MTPDKNGIDIAEELRLESERLRELAEKLKAREQALAEMESTYRHLVKYAYAKLREDFKIQDGDEYEPEDVEAMIRDGRAFPLEAFIEDINRIVEKR